MIAIKNGLKNFFSFAEEDGYDEDDIGLKDFKVGKQNISVQKMGVYMMLGMVLVVLGLFCGSML